MKLVTPQLTVTETDGFVNDLLRRKSYGQELLKLVENSSDELVISLDGQWGDGKTTFVRMWQGLLNDAHIPNIYIDAFANDYVDDAFIAIASAITTYANKYNHLSDKKKIEHFKESAKKVGVQLFAFSTKIALKAATLGALSAEDFKGLGNIREDIAKGASELASNFVEERLNSHAKDIELLQSFRQLLSELPALLMNGADGEGKPLIIIIDELDRCKPTYAVEVLEKIKHLFAVKNVVFVLVINKKQLEEAIKCIYGPNIDAHGYLQKFINIETSIPKRVNDNHVTDIRKYCQQLFTLHEFRNAPQVRRGSISIDYMESCIEPLAIHFNLSLRRLERVFTNLSLFYNLSDEDEFRPTALICFLAVIKVADPSLFECLLHRKISYTELCRVTGLSDDNRFRLIKYALLPNLEYGKEPDEQHEFDKFEEALREHFIKRETLIPLFAQKLMTFNVVGPYL